MKRLLATCAVAGLAGSFAADIATADDHVLSSYTCGDLERVIVEDEPRAKSYDENGTGSVCRSDRPAGNSAQERWGYVDDWPGEVPVEP